MTNSVFQAHQVTIWIISLEQEDQDHLGGEITGRTYHAYSGGEIAQVVQRVEGNVELCSLD